VRPEVLNFLTDRECSNYLISPAPKALDLLEGGLTYYTNQYFLAILLCSILLAFLDLDRIYLGQTGTTVGKLPTMGALGIRWVVDIAVLVS